MVGVSELSAAAQAYKKAQRGEVIGLGLHEMELLICFVGKSLGSMERMWKNMETRVKMGTSMEHPLKILNNRRKFRSQTSDNMDRWKSRGGKSQGGEEEK